MRPLSFFYGILGETTVCPGTALGRFDMKEGFRWKRSMWRKL